MDVVPITVLVVRAGGLSAMALSSSDPEVKIGAIAAVAVGSVLAQRLGKLL